MVRVIPEGVAFREHVLLRDGRGVLIRAGTPEDLPLVKELMERVSPESLRLRFGAAIREVPQEVLKRLTRGDFTREGCLLAIVIEDGRNRVVGKANYMALETGRSAEFAMLVDDSYRGLGISTLLLERLAGLAAANDFTELVAEVLPENTTMLRVLQSSGLELRQGRDHGTVQIVIPIRSIAAFREAARVRRQIAVTASLTPVLHPSSLAVIGVSASGSSAGDTILRQVMDGGYTGTLHAVGSGAAGSEALPVYRSLEDIPQAPELAIVAVPARAVLEIEKQAARAGVKALVVVSTGFAEAGPEGATLQDRLVDQVRAHGLRLVGPCSLGVINTNPAVSLNASLARSLPPRGSLGFFSHSGALGLSVLEYAAARGVGFSTFVAAGNRADVQLADLLVYWEEDPDTQMAALYLETFGDPRRFTRSARHMTPRKPILCIKTARTAAGKAAAREHTGAPCPESSGIDEEILFRQAGVIRTNDLEELLDVVLLLENQPLPPGNRIALVTNSGGLGTLCADACQAHGLCPSDSGPVHIAITEPPDHARRAIQEALADPHTDAVLGAFACLGDWTPPTVADQALLAVSAQGGHPSPDKPIILCLVGRAPTHMAELAGPQPIRIPVYRFPESAVRALAHAARYAAFRRRPAGTVRWRDDVDAAAARHRIHELLAARRRSATVALDAVDSAFVLSAFGISVRTCRPIGVYITVRFDALFGPIVELRRPGMSPVFRLTPLTDRDIAETLEAIHCSHLEGLGELLSRLSQLVEELPWVCRFEGNAGCSDGRCFCPGVQIEIGSGNIFP
ncbi:MAG: GNAT family N-acetyltransferase [Acidobacteria bacterium]|nr:GNAT family N-acetyltransferase [Acidobacteriota bacterium]